MRRLVFGLGFSLIMTLVAAVGVRAEAGLEKVIENQIEAFQADDFSQAFSYASPGIQAFFGTPEKFGAMVQNGYPMVIRPADVQFLELQSADGFWRQKVLIRDQQGVIHILDYEMIQTEWGWRIDGVHILQAPEIGT